MVLPSLEQVAGQFPGRVVFHCAPCDDFVHHARHVEGAERG